MSQTMTFVDDLMEIKAQDKICIKKIVSWLDLFLGKKCVKITQDKNACL